MKTVNSWVNGLNAKKRKVWYHMDCVEAGDRKKFLCGNRTFRVLILFLTSSKKKKKRKESQFILIHPTKHFEAYFFKFIRHV